MKFAVGEVEITDLDLYWLAGLLEGEGSFMMPTPSASKSSISIGLHMKDEDIVQRAALLMGVSSMRASKVGTYRIQVKNGRAAAWMRLLLPLMGQRRQARITELLAYYDAWLKSPNNHRKRIRPDEIVRILALKAEGVRMVDIVRQTGRTHTSIYQILRKHGEVSPSKS